MTVLKVSHAYNTCMWLNCTHWPLKLPPHGTGHYSCQSHHDDVIKWKHFPRYWPFVRGIHRSPVNSPHKGQWRGALKFSLICAWTNGWVSNREAGDLRRYRAHDDVTVISFLFVTTAIKLWHALAIVNKFCTLKLICYPQWYSVVYVS